MSHKCLLRLTPLKLLMVESKELVECIFMVQLRSKATYAPLWTISAQVVSVASIQVLSSPPASTLSVKSNTPYDRIQRQSRRTRTTSNQSRRAICQLRDRTHAQVEVCVPLTCTLTRLMLLLEAVTARVDSAVG